MQNPKLVAFLDIANVNVTALLNVQNLLLLGLAAIAVVAATRIWHFYFKADVRTGAMNRSAALFMHRLLLSVWGIALVVVAGFVFDMSDATKLIGCAISIAAALAPALYFYLRSNWAADDIENAEAHTAVALAAFDKLIHTGGDLIGKKDLRMSIESSAVAPDLAAAAKFMLEHYEDIGHVIKSTSKKTLVPVGATGGVYATKKTVRAYGISRSDLETYADRLRKRHARWL